MKLKIGFWSFVVGLLITIVVSIMNADSPPGISILAIAILGIIVGLANINDKELMLYLVASITFIISFNALSAIFNVVTLGWPSSTTFFRLLNMFVAPAAAVVALKALYNVAKD